VSEAAARGRGCGGGTRGGTGRDSEMDFGGNGGVFGRAGCTDGPEVEVVSRAGASSVRWKEGGFFEIWDVSRI
jgi:hypothetical protein